MTCACAACGERISAKSMSGLCHACAMRDIGVNAWAGARAERQAQRQAVIDARKAARERPMKRCAWEGCGAAIGTRREEARFCMEHRAQGSAMLQREACSGWPRGRAKVDPIGRVRDGDIRLHAHAAVAMGPRSVDEARILAAMLAAGVPL